MTFRLITSLQNPRVKAAARRRSGRDRSRQERILIDGIREVQRAYQAGVRLHEMFVCLAESDADEADWMQSLEAAGVGVYPVTPSVFGRLAYGQRDQGVVAVATPPRPALAKLVPAADALLVVLERVEKPGNVGAVVRTADATAASAVIVADGATDLYNPNAIRASLGTIFSVPVYAASSRETLAWLRRHQVRTLAARVEAAESYTRVSYQGPTAIVLGSEAEGLSDIWQGADISPISLPMRGLADSLNVSTTAAVLLYEALRQRQANAACPPPPA